MSSSTMRGVYIPVSCLQITQVMSRCSACIDSETIDSSGLSINTCWYDKDNILAVMPPLTAVMTRHMEVGVHICSATCEKVAA